MSHSDRLIGSRFFALLALLACAGVVRATPPVLQSAVSRMVHGSAGTFDVQLPLSGGTGIECRSVAAGMTLVLTFDQPISSGTAAVTAGTATLGTTTLSGTTMTVTLTAVGPAQAVTVTASNVTNAGNEVLASVDVPFRVLLGDISGNGIVTSTDVNICRGAVATGLAVTGATFRSDITINGILTSTDVNLVRGQASVSATVAGPATFNTAPTISTVGNLSAVTGVTTSPVGFTVGDAESDPSTLGIVVTSSDQNTLPLSGIAVTGTGTSRSLTLTPTSGITSVVVVNITLAASDGLLSSTPTAFTVTVTPPPVTYLATLQPVAGVNSLGSGTATLIVSGDQTYATLKYSYSNLSGTDSDDAIYAPPANVLYDIPVAKARGDQQPDGSYKWTFTNGGSNTIASILAAIQSNTAYLLIESSAVPSGELQGTFKLVVGSQTFTPPAAPPAITINPPTPADASRFLQQAGFGGTSAEIAALSNAGAANASTAINDWITAQFNTQIPISPDYSVANAPVAGTFSSSSAYQYIYNRVTTAQPPHAYGDGYQDDRNIEAWWRNAITAPTSFGNASPRLTAKSSLSRKSTVRLMTMSWAWLLIMTCWPTTPSSTFGNFWVT